MGKLGMVEYLAPHSFSKGFKDLMINLENKYGKDIFNLSGIGYQLDINAMSKEFFNNEKNTADISIDSNANVGNGGDLICYSYESNKPLQLLNSYYRLWKGLLKNRSLEYANEIIEKQINGSIYINDFYGISSNKAYCFNYSAYDTALNGIPKELDSRGESVPPQYLYSFKSQIEMFCLIAGNSTIGAVGMADFLIVLSLYFDAIMEFQSDAHFKFNSKEDCYNYVRETITSFIYTMNQPFRGDQSLFTNLSVFDDNFLEKLCPTYTLELRGKFYTAQTESVKKLQNMYLDIMNKELKRRPLTFPITTACFSVDVDNNILDSNFLEYVSKVNLEFGFINIYCGKTSTLSSCCFSKDTKVLTKSSNKGVLFDSFENIFKLSPYDDYKKNFTVYHNGSWCKGKIIKLPLQGKKMFKIVTSNHKELLVTEDHVHLTDTGNKKTVDLTTKDFLAFSNRELDSYPEKCQKLTYNQGIIIGLYLGDGSKYKRKDCESYEITFSLNESNIPDLTNLKEGLSDWGIEKELHIHMQNNTMLTKIYSKELYDIINEYVIGSYAPEKELDMNILLQSVEFRKGICDGWYASDGGNSNRIYTTSKNLIPQAEALFNSIGMNTITDVCDRTGEGVIVIRDVEYNRNYPTYCIRWYDMKNKRSMKDVYKIVNNSEYFKINSIEEIEYNDEFVYCFEMLNNDEPYFTLPNGVITHNCRLRSETENEYFNSFGSGSSKIGSLGVCTINLPKLATMSIGTNTFKEQLRILTIDCQEVNNIKRCIIKKAIKNGNAPLYTLSYMSLSKQYSTVGICGLYECLEILGYDILTEKGQAFASEILNIINETNDEQQKRFKAPHNLEQIPAENVAVKLAKKDNMLGNNDKYDLYSNQFVPLVVKANMLDRLSIQGLLDSKFSGGSIAHINVEQRITEHDKLKTLIKATAKQGVIYFAINYVLLKCKNNHITVGNSDICSICGELIEDRYTRVVGFMTSVSNWSKTRRELDFKNRQFYKGI